MPQKNDNLPPSAAANSGAEATKGRKESNHFNSPKVAIIGAGSSGLVTLKTLRQHGIFATCFEIGNDIGGLWVFGNSNGRGGAYRSLHINTSTARMQYSDFPMPDNIGTFPHRSHVQKYFDNYAEHFGLRQHIRFNHEVTHASPREGGGYRLTFASGTHQDFDALIVANGHHVRPFYPQPDPAADFEGVVMHSNQYIDPQSPHDLRDKRVLVVGMGNSAMDIACELSRNQAKKVCVSTRRGAWVLPKYLRGKAIDDDKAIIPSWLPQKLRRKLVTKGFELLYGKMSDFGLPEPDHLIGESHPTVSSDFPPLVASGDIHMRPGINGATCKVVTFSDNSQEEFDVIVYCTGYQIDFPFFDPEHVSAPENEIPLFFRAFSPSHRQLFFVGLLQTVGAVMPVAEAQAKAIALHLAGKYNLPDPEQMQAAIKKHDSAMRARFVASKRHTMQVIPEDFHRELQQELKRGELRSRAGQGQAFHFTKNTNPT